MIVEIDESLKVCFSNKYLEDRIREHLRDKTLAYIIDPKRGFIVLYNKPLATLIIGLGGQNSVMSSLTVPCYGQLPPRMTA